MRRAQAVRSRRDGLEEFNPDSPTIRVRSPRSGVVYSTVDTNLNTNWLENKASWLYYSLLVLASWLVVSNFVDPGLAWYVWDVGLVGWWVGWGFDVWFSRVLLLLLGLI